MNRSSFLTLWEAGKSKTEGWQTVRAFLLCHPKKEGQSKGKRNKEWPNLAIYKKATHTIIGPFTRIAPSW